MSNHATAFWLLSYDSYHLNKIQIEALKVAKIKHEHSLIYALAVV